MTKTLSLMVLILTCLLLVATEAMAQNLVTNGGFETGDFSGWVTDLVTDCHATGPGTASGVIRDGALLPCSGLNMSVRNGYYAAALGSIHPEGQDAYLSQTLTNVPGASYVINIYLANCRAWATCDSSNDANHFQVQWNGKVLLDQYNVGSNYGNEYTLYTFHVTASGSVTPFAIRGFNADFFFLDDISVSPVAGASPPFTGSPGAANCVGENISVLAQRYGGLAQAAAAFGYSSVSDLHNAVVAYCGR